MAGAEYRAGRLPPFSPIPWELQDDPEIDSHALAVYSALKRFADFGKPTGAKVSTRKVAEKAGCSAATVERRRALLREKGWLEWQSGKNGGSKNSYVVHSRLQDEEEGGSLSVREGSLSVREGGPSERGSVPTENQLPRTSTESGGEGEEETLPFGERELPLFGGTSAYRRNELLPARSFAEKAWKLWLEELGGDPPVPKLTEKRKDKLERLWEERMHAHGFPQAYVVFRGMLRALQESEHHMSRRSYQMPESFLKNEERRERWYFEGLELAKEPKQEGSASHSAMDAADFVRREEQEREEDGDG